MLKNILIFIPNTFSPDKSGFIEGFYKNCSNFEAYYITNSQVLPKCRDHIGYAGKFVTSEFLTENSIFIERGTNNIKINCKESNQQSQIIEIYYDIDAVQNTEVVDENEHNYGVHLNELTKRLSRKGNKERINGTKHIMIYWLVVLVDLMIKIYSKLRPLLKSCTILSHMESATRTLKWILTNLSETKTFSPKLSNICVAKILDLLLGISFVYICVKYECTIISSVHYISKDFITHLRELLIYLMGSPIGLKLNYAFNHSLGKFFFYHISLWRVFLLTMQPLLEGNFKLLLMPAFMGLSYQIAVLCDLISLATFHVYCIYVYAARLFSLQIKGLTSLWRLFIGRKSNPLRGRVDSCEYSSNQLFIGTLGFTILLFLLPTTTMYYTVFAARRVIENRIVMELALRKSYRGQLTKLIRSVDDVLKDDSVSSDDVTVLIDRIKALNESLKDLNDKLAPSFKEEQFEDECQKIVEYDDNVTKAVAQLQCKVKSEVRMQNQLQNELDEANGAVATDTQISNVGNDKNTLQRTTVRLPKLDIAKFNGDISHWPEFWEQYNVAIHQNSSLDNTAKFAYLKSYLIGKAAVTISGLASGRDSYENAIDLLKSEYACIDKIMDTYIQRLLSLTPFKYEKDIFALRKLFNTVSTIIKSLSTLGISADQYGLLVKSVVFKSLPYNMRVAYKKKKLMLDRSADNVSVVSNVTGGYLSSDKGGDFETEIKDLLQFIKVELESIEQASGPNDNKFETRDNKKPNRFTRNIKCSDGHGSEFTAAGLFTGAREICLFCKSKSHITAHCDSSVNITAKKDILKQNKLCFRCTKPNHNSRFCKTRDISCGKCKRRHVTSMCEGNTFNMPGTSARTDDRRDVAAVADNSLNQNSVSLVANGIVDDIYLKTACAHILTDIGEPLVRMVIDGGSQLSFIREEVSRKLGLPRVGTHKISIQAFGQSDKAPARLCNRVKIQLKSQHSNNVVEIYAVEVPEICFNNLTPPSLVNPIIKEFSLTNCLADFVRGSEKPINGFFLLIGSDNYWKIVFPETVKLTDRLTAINTHFGWTIHGVSELSEDSYIVNFNASVVLHVHSQVESEFLDLKKFWDLETLGIKADNSNAITGFTDDFIKNNVFFENNRYHVTLPWECDKPLDSNFSGAYVRTKGLVNKLAKSGKLIEYDSAMREYINSGCAEVAPNDKCNGGQSYYLPHRPVYRDDKETTKIRVVFDASAHSIGSLSLNDKLSAGQNLLPDLLKILLNFRIGAIAVIADIEKAFLQIGLCENDKDYHRFLWYREPLKGNISSLAELPDFTTFRMTRVTFGVTTSPFLLAVVLKKHLTNSTESDVSRLLLESFYVDDLVLAVGSDLEAVDIYEKARNILSQANMNLRKWCTNNHTLMQRFVNDNVSSAIDNFVNVSKKVLGVVWKPFTDEISIDLNAISFTVSVLPTKRMVLQSVAKVFDPIGVLGPFTVIAKILLQDMWKRNLNWDEVLPQDLTDRWSKWQRELSQLKDFSIKRCMLPNPTDEAELHVFADASPRAYGCVAYIKNLASSECYFIASKHRVAPINRKSDKLLTLPKLELTAAVCAARLLKYLLDNLNLNIKKKVIWSDSKITLYWIKGKDKKWEPYVKNRVFEIHKLLDDVSLRYCPGKQNPADLITRGVPIVTRLIDSEIWLSGPSWLCLDKCGWPEEESFENTEYEALTCLAKVEERPNFDVIKPIFSLDLYSNLDKVYRITAYIKRFLNNVQKTKIKITGQLTVYEIFDAEAYWFRITQQEAFKEEVFTLSINKPFPAQSKLLELKPFLDELGVLRLGGRLHEACLSSEEKHPVILPQKSTLTTRIICKAHDEALHSGVNATMAVVRRRFWITRARQSVKSFLNGCLKCKRLKGKHGNQPFAPLPRERVTLSHPFDVTGIDFFGPLYIVDNNQGKQKVYVLLLTCAAVRVVHLELVQNLMTESCISALRRFIARRGVPSIIYSDNAKTFKRASEEISQLQNNLKEDKVQDLARSQRIDWKFIVEKAAWWGGFWERLVRTVKNALKATLGKKLINFDELQTILSEVEMVVNSRPITYIDEDPGQLVILSPAKFLIGNKSLSLNTDLKQSTSQREDILRAWKLRETLVYRFWKRWNSDYLQQLRSAHYGKQSRGPRFNVGDVVLLHDQYRPRLSWKLVRVTKCFQGRDSRVRACEVISSEGTTLRRPVQLLYPLEIEHSGPGEDVKNQNAA